MRINRIRGVGSSTKKVSKKKSKRNSIDSLDSIEGIGKKTAAYLEDKYGTLEDLKKALSDDKVKLRKDLCEKLKKHLM